MKKPFSKPQPARKDLSKAIPAASQKAMFNSLSGQIQGLATRLEALRAQGAGNSKEFKQLEAMLHSVQDKLLLAQAKMDAQ